MVERKKATRKKKATSRKKRHSKKTSTPENQKDSCFVIMPFSGWFEDYYSSIFCPAIEAAGLQPRRADDLYRPSTIVSDIWVCTQKAKLILADLSGKNPNVFYELGLAHALAKPAILVVESMDDVPFDLRALRILEYDKNNPNWGELLREMIEKAIEEVLANPHESVPVAFVEARPPRPTATLTAQDKELLEIRQELDLLREQFRDRPLRHRESISPTEARALVRKYLEIGVPNSIIVRRLVNRGAPEHWVEKTLGEMMTEFKPLPKSAAVQVSASGEQQPTKSVSTSESRTKAKLSKRKAAKKKAEPRKAAARKKSSKK